MKKAVLTLIIIFLCATPPSVQAKREYNSMGIGDEIIKQQIECRGPSEVGSDKVWNFSNLKFLINEYTLMCIPFFIGKTAFI